MRTHQSKWTVLIVDNEPDILQVVSDMLELSGAITYTAGSGEAALDLLQRITPTFVLTDLSMPGINGWDLLTEIRHDPILRSLPVLALTAHALLGDREKVLDFGFDGYIAKPFQMQNLIREITGCLAKRAVA
jgi:CheY-like chemotaxis protein